jgi:K+/H+ antiporter YhaU regulatory subunit KhtT
VRCERREPQDIEMIRLGKSIRLTRREVERFTKITGITPVQVRTLDDLDEYIKKCKAHFWGVSEDTRFLHSLLDEERLRCLGAA